MLKKCIFELPQSEALNPEVILERLRFIRSWKKIRLSEIADQCATTPQTISRILAGEVSMSLKWLFAICQAMNVEPTILFSDDEATKEFGRFYTLAGALKDLNKQQNKVSRSMDEIMQLIDKLDRENA